MKRPLFVLFWTITLDLIGFGIILPLMPLYASRFGASGAQVGLLMVGYSLMQLFFAPLWGRLSDAIGRRSVLLVSVLGNALALLVFAWAQDYAWLLGARLIAGMCTANISVAHAYVADVTAPEGRARGMGLLGAAFGVGLVIGPFLGGELSVLGYSAPALFAAVLALVNAVLVLAWLPESLPAAGRTQLQSRGFLGVLRSVWRERLVVVQSGAGVRQILFLIFAHVFAFSMLEMAFVLFANHRMGFEVKEAGRVFAYVGVVLAVVQGRLLGPLVQRFGEHRLVWAGLLLNGIGLASLPYSPAGGWALLLGIMTLVAVGQALTGPSLSALLSRRIAPERQGLVFGVSQSCSALARATGPYVAGHLYDLGSSVPFFVGGGLAVVAFAIALFTLQGIQSRSPGTQIAAAGGQT